MSDGQFPKLGINAFNCPHCHVYAQQHWHGHSENNCFSNFMGSQSADNYVYMSTCEQCGKNAVWVSGLLVFPHPHLAPAPNPDLNEDIVADYKEADAILQMSPRGACALLRLATQKLCIQLGESGENLNKDISNLVKSGLSPHIQKSLDILRVIGNNAVHPGELDVRDTPESALALFKLINKIAQTMITDVKEIDEIYDSLPEEQREAIARRDKSKSAP